MPDNTSDNSAQNPSEDKADDLSHHSKNPPLDLRYYQRLADRWKNGKITPAEMEELEAWYGLDKDWQEKLEIPDSVADSAAAHEKRMLDQIYRQIQDKATLPDRRSFGRIVGYISKSPYLKAAAVIVFALAIGMIYKFYNGRKVSSSDQSNLVVNKVTDIAPGHSGAVLKLDDGSTILLDSLQENEIVRKGDVEITKRNGALQYVGKASRTLYNEVVTQRGRQWKMILPDGTKVWLNAASSLRYPVSFSGGGRVVELSGEAYFEVVHDPKRPFKVKTKAALIEDIGTAFNVSAYPDESSVKTTLVEGIVQVGGVRLKPGEQAKSRAGEESIAVSSVDVTGETAWVNGQLSMDNKSVKELMRQLSRWYDVDVVYEGAVPDKKLGGIIDRNAYLSDIIHALSAYGIRLKLESENRKIIVSPN